MSDRREAASKNSSCVKCGVSLKDFAGYIPGKGEVCMKCYNQFARESEKSVI